jgi:hypothetical protein
VHHKGNFDDFIVKYNSNTITICIAELLKESVWQNMKTDNSNKPGSDCSSGASSTDAALVLETYLSHLLAASPKLDIAAKNLIAVLLGAESARSETDMMSTEVAGGKSTISSSPSSSAPTTTALPVQSPSLGRREEIRADVALKCVRLILKAVALLTLPDTPQWGVEHPQGEKQTFSERAEQLSHYKVCLMLLTRAQQSSTSPSKLLGQEFFQVTKCWPKVRAAAMAAAPSDVPPAALETCLDLFERSIEGAHTYTLHHASHLLP